MSRYAGKFQRDCGSVTCGLSHTNRNSVCLRGCVRLRGSAPAACLSLKEPIYNSQHLLCIPREDCLVWAAPDFNLASQLQFPNLTLRLSVPVCRSRADFTFACQRASATPLPFQRVNSGCICHHKSRSQHTSFSLSHGWVSVRLCVQTSVCCVLCCPSSSFNSGSVCAALLHM